MNKAEILAMKCKRVAGHNVKCFRIMMELVDGGREDLVNEIVNSMNYDHRSLTPEKICNVYDECGGKEGFLKRCNKIWNKSNYNSVLKEYEYEEELKRYTCGEQAYHPDGTRFEEDGSEITYE